MEIPPTENVYTLENTCRLCLKIVTSEILHPLFSRKINGDPKTSPELIELFKDLKFDDCPLENDGGPQSICQTCKTNSLDSIKFCHVYATSQIKMEEIDFEDEPKPIPLEFVVVKTEGDDVDVVVLEPEIPIDLKEEFNFLDDSITETNMPIKLELKKQVPTELVETISIGIHKCDNCWKTFTDEVSFVTHTRFDCKGSFTSIEELNDHLSATHQYSDQTFNCTDAREFVAIKAESDDVDELILNQKADLSDSMQEPEISIDFKEEISFSDDSITEININEDLGRAASIFDDSTTELNTSTNLVPTDSEKPIANLSALVVRKTYHRKVNKKIPEIVGKTKSYQTKSDVDFLNSVREIRNYSNSNTEINVGENLRQGCNFFDDSTPEINMPIIEPKKQVLTEVVETIDIDIHKCDHCWATFTDKLTFVTHVRFHCKINKMMYCGICRGSFASIEELNDHISAAHNSDPPFKCTALNCTRTFTTDNYLRQHIYKKHREHSKTCNKIKMRDKRRLRKQVAAVHPGDTKTRDIKKQHREPSNVCYKVKKRDKKRLRKHGAVAPPGDRKVTGREIEILTDSQHINYSNSNAEINVSENLRQGCNFLDDSTPEINIPLVVHKTYYRKINRQIPETVGKTKSEVDILNSVGEIKILTDSGCNFFDDSTPEINMPINLDPEKQVPTEIVEEINIDIHKCDHCWAKFTDAVSYVTHIRFHCKKEIMMYCGICKDSFASIEELNDHLATPHSSDRSFICTALNCTRAFMTDDCLGRHITKMHRKPSKICNKVKKKDKRPGDTKTRHIRKQNLEPNKVCNKMKTRDKRRLRKQDDVAHPGDSKVKVTCDVCGKNGSRIWLHKHSETHIKYIPKYECSHCGKNFKMRHKMQEHERTHKSDKPFQCSHCDQSFRLKFQLKYHMNKWHTDTTHPCQVCDKVFLSEKSLKLHMIKFHCARRRKIAATGDQNNKHEYRGEKPFKCIYCDKSFRLQTTLLKHSENIHSDCVFECSICHNEYKNLVDLERHKKTHTNGKRKFNCAKCDFSNGTPACLDHTYSTDIYVCKKTAKCVVP